MCCSNREFGSHKRIWFIKSPSTVFTYKSSSMIEKHTITLIICRMFDFSNFIFFYVA